MKLIYFKYILVLFFTWSVGQMTTGMSGPKFLISVSTTSRWKHSSHQQSTLINNNASQ